MADLNQKGWNQDGGLQKVRKTFLNGENNVKILPEHVQRSAGVETHTSKENNFSKYLMLSFYRKF